MPDLKYPGSTPVDEPVAPRKVMKKPMMKPMMKPVYGYTIKDGTPIAKDMSGDKYDADAEMRGTAQQMRAFAPDRKAMRYLGMGNDDGDVKTEATGSGAGRGKGYAKGGSVGSASRRADGIAVKGKTKGRMI